MEWGVWAAVSDKQQTGEGKESIPEQIRLAKAAAEKWGGTVRDEHVMVVPGRSRSIIEFAEAERKIEAYATLRRLLDERKIKVLCYYSDDRLGRKKELILTLKALCREAGVILYDLSNPPQSLTADKYSSSRSYVDSISAATAEDEVERLQQRLEDERSSGGRWQRAQDVFENGVYRMERGATEDNQWLRTHIRAWVRDGNLTKVDLL